MFNRDSFNMKTTKTFDLTSEVMPIIMIQQNQNFAHRIECRTAASNSRNNNSFFFSNSSATFVGS